jgi:hypothetical protein
VSLKPLFACHVYHPPLFCLFWHTSFNSIHRHRLLSKRKDDVEDYIRSLDAAWAAARADPSCLVVAADASVPKCHTYQAVAAALVFRAGAEARRVTSAAGRRTAPEAERFALQIGISAALGLADCQHLVLFSDSAPAVESLLDPAPRSGQVFSLDVCKAVRPWLAGDANRTVSLWHVPSRFEWGVHQKAHDVATSFRISLGVRPRTSKDFLSAGLDESAVKEWHELFKQPGYRGASFLDLNGPKDKPLKPSTHKCGPWMRKSDFTCPGFARSCRGITNHAPIGEYRRRFHLEGVQRCPCAFLRGRRAPLQTRDHILRVCSLYERSHDQQAPLSIEEWYQFLKANPLAMAFPPREWDPG